MGSGVSLPQAQKAFVESAHSVYLCYLCTMPENPVSKLNRHFDLILYLRLL